MNEPIQISSARSAVRSIEKSEARTNARVDLKYAEEALLSKDIDMAFAWGQIARTWAMLATDTSNE